MTCRTVLFRQPSEEAEQPPLEALLAAFGLEAQTCYSPSFPPSFSVPSPSFSCSLPLTLPSVDLSPVFSAIAQFPFSVATLFLLRSFFPPRCTAPSCALQPPLLLAGSRVGRRLGCPLFPTEE